MPRDQRLYMTFPNDFHRHPKITRLSLEARWAFVEMNGEARIADNDGVFDAADAEFVWGAEIMAALVASHPVRPLVIRVGETYVIREYAEHQQSRAEREELSAKRAEAGRKGGLAKSQANASHPPSRHQQTQAESESEDFYSPSKSQSSSSRARVSTDAIPISAMTKRLAGQQGVTNLRAVVDSVAAHCGVRITADQAYQLALHVLGKRKTPPESGQRYVLAAIEMSPAEIQQHIYESMEVA